VEESILILNGGSSSIKFACFTSSGDIKRTLSGKIERIGTGAAKFTFKDSIKSAEEKSEMVATDYASAINSLLLWLNARVEFEKIKAVGHRIVFGMKHTQTEKITEPLLAELKRLIPYDQDHLPGEILLIEEISKKYPALPQYACFDTAFHAEMPRVAKILPIPRRFDLQGIQRYGFHGISYAYLVEKLRQLEGCERANGRFILAHLGSGASLAAVKNGKSVDTSMGFTPAAGIPMSSRTGDLDPGVAWYMIKNENLSMQQFDNLINHESGLLGVSETSADMQDLLKIESTDIRAAEAIALFCYQVKKWIGAYAAVLGGLDTLVFSGGIGENAAVIRKRICEGLEFLGIEIAHEQNERNEGVISTAESRVAVRVIQTDEEWMMARVIYNIIK
jgi:acetate kinase